MTSQDKHSKYEGSILEFVNSGGSFVSYTNDNNFQSLLTRLLTRQLAVQQQCVHNYYSREHIVSYLKAKAKNKEPVVLFVERIFEGASTQEFVLHVKNAYSNVYVIVLTNEVERAALIRLYEVGADNFITKPLSLNTLVEKIAFTLRPQSKIGELIEKSKRLLEQNQLEPAMAACDEVLSMKPNSAAAHMAKGDVYRALGKQQEAIDEYMKAHKSSHLYLEPLKRLAEFYGEIGDLEDQLSYLIKLDKLSPLNVERKVEIGSLQLEKGETVEGRKFLDEALRIAGREAKEMLGNLAVQIADRLMHSNNEVAEQYYRRALQVKGGSLGMRDVETFNRLGICLRQQKKPKKAIEEYQRALEIAPRNERLLYNIAMAYLEAGEVEEANSSLQALFEVNARFAQDNEVVSHNIGMVLAYAEKQKQALGFFQQALQINPSYEPSRKMIAKLSEEE
jgi:tetratricopeptide (TPR) repeat protein